MFEKFRKMYKSIGVENIIWVEVGKEKVSFVKNVKK
jgi:hypothetical protein